MKLKTKIALVFLTPIYVTFIFVIFTAVWIINIFLFVMKVTGFIEAFMWLLMKTAEVIKLRQFKASLHKNDLDILNNKDIKAER